MTIDTAIFDYEATLQACAARSEQALHALYRQESRRLLGVALRIVRDRQIAEDIVHDTFVSIWTRAATFDPVRGDARGWIYSITRHRALNVARKELRAVSLDEETLEAIESESAHENFRAMPEAFPARVGLGALEECLARLDAAKRNSILYAYVDGCTHSEIAQRLQSPLGTVKAWIKRGMAALRECLT